MAGSLNQVNIIGNLGADPETRSFSNGGRVANLRVATSEEWKDKQTGEKKTRVEWHAVTVTGDGLVGVVERYTRKGSKIYVQGKLQTRKWTDRDGNDRYSTEVVVGGMSGQLILLDGPSGDGGQRGGGFGGQPPKKPEQQSWGDDLDDTVPFMSCDMRYEGRVS